MHEVFRSSRRAGGLISHTTGKIKMAAEQTGLEAKTGYTQRYIRHCAPLLTITAAASTQTRRVIGLNDTRGASWIAQVAGGRGRPCQAEGLVCCPSLRLRLASIR
jgi:hypothetical protein